MYLFQRTIKFPITIFINKKIKLREQDKTLHEGTVKGLIFDINEKKWAIALYKSAIDNSGSADNQQSSTINNRLDLSTNRLLKSHVTFIDQGWAGTIEEIEEISDPSTLKLKEVNLNFYWSYYKDPDRPETELPEPVGAYEWILEHYKNQDN